MIVLQKKIDIKNSCHSATKKIRSYCNTKYPTKDQVK